MSQPRDDQRFADMISCISHHEACELDAIVGPFDRRLNPVGRAIFPSGVAPARPEPRMRGEDTACIGYRVREPKADAALVAMQLATLAMEKGAEVIILSHLPYSGFERFGFRCERVCGETEAERLACEEQIRTFWTIEIVL